MTIYTFALAFQRAISGVATLLLLVPAIGCADTVSEQRSLPDILTKQPDGPFLPDFSFAGYRNGVVELPVADGQVINVSDHGARPDDDKDDTKAVLAAIEKARSVDGPVVVRFDAGRYRITEVLEIDRSDFVLQGAGSGDGGTTLFFPRPLNQVETRAPLSTSCAST